MIDNGNIEEAHEGITILSNRFNDIFNKNKKEQDWDPSAVRVSLQYVVRYLCPGSLVIM